MKLKIKRTIIISAILILIIVIIYLCRALYMDFYYDKIQIIDLESKERHLLFYGSRHSNDKSDPMFKDIEERFYSTKPQIVLVEGDYNEYKYDNVDTAIAEGESAFVTYLAQKEKILLKSVEPSPKEQYEYLLQKYDKDRVLMMYILRQTYQYQNQNDVNPINYEETIKNFVNSIMDEGFPITEEEARLANILSLLEQYTEQGVDNNSWLKLDVKAFVFRDGTEFNEIYNDITAFRNNYLVTSIEKTLKNYDRIFVIMGGGHVREERKQIEEIFNSIAD